MSPMMRRTMTLTLTGAASLAVSGTVAKSSAHDRNMARDAPDALDCAPQAAVPLVPEPTQHPQGPYRSSRPPEARIPVWQQLRSLTAAEKVNTRLHLDVAAGADSEVVRAKACEAEILWNRGDAEGATDLLQDLAATGVRVAAGVEWPTAGAAAGFDWGPDARIGTRIDLQNLELTYHADTGHLFTITEYAVSDCYTRGAWAIWMSTNGGTTWTRTYTLYADLCTNGVAAVVAGEYLYVAYQWVLCGVDIRRFAVADGHRDDYSATVFDRCNPYVLDIALTSNADSYDTNVYLVATASDESLLYAYATASIGIWNEVPTGITNALYGLDASYCQGPASHYLYVSYVGRNPSGSPSNPLRVARKDATGWDVTDVEPNPRLGSDTRISAYRNWVMTVYEYDLFPDGVGVRYRVSYDGGDTWKVGTVAQPSSGAQYQRPDVSARRGGGFGVTYLESGGAPADLCWFRWRDYGDGTPGSAPWSTPSQVSAKFAVVSQPTRVECLPPPEHCERSYGALFVSNCLEQGVYFNRTDIDCRSRAPADFDDDGDVDLTDFTAFQACFNGPNRAPHSSCKIDADFDGDGDVDLNDFTVFQGCFNGPNRTPRCSP